VGRRGRVNSGEKGESEQWGGVNSEQWERVNSEQWERVNSGEEGEQWEAGVRSGESGATVLTTKVA
jgi:hypothetical protein